MAGPSRAALEEARNGTIADVIGPHLRVLFCGINPSLYSVAVGHHFARPGNRFWRTLHGSGFTPGLLAPHEDGRLIGYRLGVTNLVPRATARADELTPEELRQGAAALAERVAAMLPQFVAIAGVSAYRVAFGVPQAQAGRQDLTLGGAGVWVVPNPSGLNAHYRLADLVEAYAALHQRVTAAATEGPG